jgi:hypothetical protein
MLFISVFLSAFVTSVAGLLLFTVNDLVDGYGCSIGDFVHFDNVLAMLGEILCSIIHREELKAKVVRCTTIDEYFTDLVEFEVIHSIDDVVHMTSREIEEMLIETFIINTTLLIGVTPKVDIVDEVL